MLETTFSQKLTLHARHSLREAREIAHYTRHSVIEPEHLLLAVFLENGSLGSILLENIGFEKESLAKLCLKKKSGTKKPISKTAPIPLSPILKDNLRRAYSLASEFQYPYVGTEHIVYALLESKSEVLENILTTLSIDEKKIHTTIESHLNFDHFPQLSKMFDLPDNVLTKNRTTNGRSTPTLDQFTTDMGDKKKGQEEI